MEVDIWELTFRKESAKKWYKIEHEKSIDVFEGQIINVTKN